MDREMDRIRQEWERLRVAQEQWRLERNREMEARNQGVDQGAGLAAGQGAGQAQQRGDVDRQEPVVDGGGRGPPRDDADMEVDGVDQAVGPAERVDWETQARLGHLEASVGRIGTAMEQLVNVLQDRETRPKGLAGGAPPRGAPVERLRHAASVDSLPGSASEVDFPRERARRAAAAQWEQRDRTVDGGLHQVRDPLGSPLAPVGFGLEGERVSREERKMLARPVAEFCPERCSVESFLLSMQQMFLVMGTTSPRVKTGLLLRSLGPTAMESVLATDMGAHTPPEELCAFLRRRFGAKLGKESAADGLETVRRGDHETIERYADRVALLAKRAEATRATAVRAFLRGANCAAFVASMEQMSLRRETRETLTLRELCESFEAGRVRGMWAEFPNEEPLQRRAVCAVAAPQRDQWNARSQAVEPVPASCGCGSGGPGPGKRGQEQDAAPPRRRRVEDDRKCFRCNKSGHLVRDCPEPAPTARGNGRR